MQRISFNPPLNCSKFSTHYLDFGFLILVNSQSFGKVVEAQTNAMLGAEFIIRPDHELTNYSKAKKGNQSC